MPEKQRMVYVQEFNSVAPHHQNALEGTAEFPIYLIGYTSPYYGGVSPIRVETLSFIENDDGSYSSTFARVLRNLRYDDSHFSMFFPPHPEDGVSDTHLLRKCKFVQEAEIERIYSSGVGLESLVMSVPELGKYISRPVRVVFDMYWEVVT